MTLKIKACCCCLIERNGEQWKCDNFEKLRVLKSELDREEIENCVCDNAPMNSQSRTDFPCLAVKIPFFKISVNNFRIFTYVYDHMHICVRVYAHTRT